MTAAVEVESEPRAGYFECTGGAEVEGAGDFFGLTVQEMEALRIPPDEDSEEKWWLYSFDFETMRKAGDAKRSCQRR